MRPRALVLLSILLVACASPKPVAPVPEAATLQAGGSGFVGRWIFSPGDSTLPEQPAAPKDAKDTKAAKDADDAKKDGAASDAAARGTSPAGAVLSLAEGGVMFAREGEFVRRGLWKFDGATLRLIVEPPPRRLEMGFATTLEGDRLTLTGAAGMVLVYHREPFVAAGNAR